MSRDGEEQLYLAIARVVAPSGIRGDVKAEILTDFPERFTRLTTVFVGDGYVAYEVESAKVHKGRVLLHLKGCDTMEAAEELRGQVVRIPVSEAVPLPEDHYYWYQVFDLEVWTVDGEYVGRIVDILERPANDVYVVQDQRKEDQRKEVLIPAIEDVVKEIDLEKGRMVIEAVPGLLD